MLERDVDLQTAVNVVTKMLSDRVNDYVWWKKQLPSFSSEVDTELQRYLKALEQFIQGTVVWNYESPRYFRGMDIANKEDLVIPVKKSAVQKLQPLNRRFDYISLRSVLVHIFMMLFYSFVLYILL